MDELRIWVCLKMDGVPNKNPLVYHVDHHFILKTVQGLAKETGGSSAISSLDLLNYKRWRQFDQERLLPVFFFGWLVLELRTISLISSGFVFMYTRYTDSDNMQLRHWKHCEPSFGPHILRTYTPSPYDTVINPT